MLNMWLPASRVKRFKVRWWCVPRAWPGSGRCWTGVPPEEVERVYVINVGGGKIGTHLAGLLLAEGHEIKVIDHRPEMLEALRAELPAGCIVEGDGSSPS